MYSKFRSNFKKKIKSLERNFEKCCDPSVKNYASIYRKNYYELPADYLVPKKFDAGSDSEEMVKNKVDM